MKQGPSPALGMSWWRDGPRLGQGWSCGSPISHSWASSTMVFSYGISLVLLQNIFAFQKEVFGNLAVLLRKRGALHLHWSISYSAPLLLPSLELWGPAHWPPDNGDLVPHRWYESTAWWSPQALWWIQCPLKHQESSQYPRFPILVQAWC